ncbi:hypothetical protein XIS1_1190023 [Xenorhabdus innexi]|uniref:Uncharacterized protein n=1 Tax=Xenorhabdus innexi TaxID=290109 RepID=A0A1N6MS00_9GAMM|nr:hypothetical protein XIS1_1190023 [Xenorhabdus innexi]
MLRYFFQSLLFYSYLDIFVEWYHEHSNILILISYHLYLIYVYVEQM